MALGDYIINDIKTINQKKNNDKLNRAIQAFLFTIVTEEVGVYVVFACIYVCIQTVKYLKLFCTLVFFLYNSFLRLGYICITRYNILLQKVSVTAKKSVQILAELYRKKIWTDARTVNVLVCAYVQSL